MVIQWVGGYAAILLASIVGKGRAIAFAPQTFISPEKRLKYSDKRWNEQIFQTYANTAHKRHVWDIKEVFPMNNKKIHVDILVSKTHRLDFIHANELQGLENVNIYTFEAGGHALVRHLRDVGALPDILRGRYAQSVPADVDKPRR